jgi:ferredoxin--NADP+ reductase
MEEQNPDTRPYVLKIKEIAPRIFDMEIASVGAIGSPALISRYAEPGQFVMIRATEESERIPLTIADTYPERNSIRLIFQVAGTSTYKLSRLKEGDYVLNIAGPLGKPSETVENRKVLLIGGGVGIAAIFPIAKHLFKKGNDVDVILGAKNASLLILKDEFTAYCDQIYLCTDDGSHGRKGFVTDIMKELLEKNTQPIQSAYSVGWAVGPTIMMRKCSEIAKNYTFHLWVSLNPVMVDGTGMCGGCRVIVNQQIYFACVDGPEFDGREVDWDNLLLRQKQFSEEERHSWGQCRLEEQMNK